MVGGAAGDGRDTPSTGKRASPPPTDRRRLAGGADGQYSPLSEPYGSLLPLSGRRFLVVTAGPVLIPASVMKRDDLRMSAKLVFGRIYSLTFFASRGRCDAKNSTIADGLGYSEKTVRNAISTLVKDGLVIREEEDGRRRLYARNVPVSNLSSTEDTVSPTEDSLSPREDTIEGGVEGGSRGEKKNGDGDAAGQGDLFAEAFAEAEPRDNGGDPDPKERIWDYYVRRYAERFSERRANRLRMSAQGRPGHMDARLEEGYTPEELMRAIDGCFDSDWHRERGKHELEFILRNQSKVEQFLTKAEEGGKPDRRERLRMKFREQDAREEDRHPLSPGPDAEAGDSEGRVIEL